MKNLLTVIIAISCIFCSAAYAQNSRAIKISVDMLEGQRSGFANTEPDPTRLEFRQFGEKHEQRTVDLYPGKRKQILSTENSRGRLTVYATSETDYIKTEFYHECEGQVIKGSSTTKKDKKSSGELSCIEDAIVDDNYWLFPAVDVYWNLENIKGKPLADFCPATVKTITDTVQYGMTIKKYFEPAGKLVEKSSTTCTYKGTVITKVSGQPTVTETNKKISIALENLVK